MESGTLAIGIPPKELTHRAPVGPRSDRRNLPHYASPAPAPHPYATPTGRAGHATGPGADAWDCAVRRPNPVEPFCGVRPGRCADLRIDVVPASTAHAEEWRPRSQRDPGSNGPEWPQFNSRETAPMETTTTTPARRRGRPPHRSRTASWQPALKSTIVMDGSIDFSWSDRRTSQTRQAPHSRPQADRRRLRRYALDGVLRSFTDRQSEGAESSQLSLAVPLRGLIGSTPPIAPCECGRCSPQARWAGRNLFPSGEGRGGQ